jgi:hypothetical protein
MKKPENRGGGNSGLLLRIHASFIALKNKSSIKTLKEYTDTPKSKGWRQLEQFFKKHRRVKWTFVCPKRVPEKNARKCVQDKSQATLDM